MTRTQRSWSGPYRDRAVTVSRLLLLLGVVTLSGCGGGTPSGPTPASLEGDYRLTLTASTICTAFPSPARARSYDARIIVDPGTAELSVSLTGNPATFIRGFPRGNTVNWRFSVTDFRASPQLWDFTTEGSGSITASTISGRMTGVIEYWPSGSQRYPCTATDHEFSFVRR